MSQAELVSAKEKALICKAVNDKHGRLTPELVVQESDPRNEDGVARELAGLIEWNDDDAVVAHRRRVDCARAVIRSVEPVLIRLGVIEISAPYYVHDETMAPGRQGYVPVLSIKSEREVAEDTIDAELERAIASLRRAYSVAVALGIEDKAAMALEALGELGRSQRMPGPESQQRPPLHA